MYNMF